MTLELTSLIVAGVITISIIVSAVLTTQSNNRYRKVSETDIMIKMNDRIYDSDRGRRILELAKNSNSIIVDSQLPRGSKRWAIVTQGCGKLLE